MSGKQINDSLSRKEDECEYPSPEQPDVQKSSKGFVSAEQKMRLREQKLQRKAERKKAKQAKKSARISKLAVFKLRKFEIDEGKLVRYIGHRSCLKIPECVTDIGDYALSYEYKYRRKLRKLIIPVSVKSIGRRVFDNCNRLKKIIYQGTKAQWKKIDKYESRTYENNWHYGLYKCIVYCVDGIVCL